MPFNTRFFALVTVFSTLASGLPLDTPRPRYIVPRAKSYAVINVDGGLSTEAPPPAVTVAPGTKTVQVVNPGPTVTQEVTTVIIQPAPAPAATSSSSQSTSSPSASSASSTSTSTITSISTPIPTPEPIRVTVTVPQAAETTEYYDDGMWHTKYRVKSFEAVVATTSFLASPSISTSVFSSSVVLPVLETPGLSYNQTSS
ncbi:hypothetical protein IQ07DRAFT_588009 [Pyrenochaeta sp. DS3sAY3a]|nr:hypothetical protein IQ07DRAFT_588009 [Pyrenochaeta sp. DS3sAY3a]